MSTNFQKFLEVLTYGYQEIENALWGVLVERTIDNAIGEQLVILGRLVGQPPIEGVGDALYRRYIRARIAANRSNANPKDILAVVRLVLDDDAAIIRHENRGDGAFTLVVDGVVFDDTVLDVLIEMLTDAVADGVRVLAQNVTSLTEPFRLAPAITTAAVAAIDTSVAVTDTSLFPTAGNAILDPDLGTAEAGNDQHDSFTYTGKTATTLTGVTGLSGSHIQGASVIPSTWVGKGLGDDASSAVGGALSTVKEHI